MSGVQRFLSRREKKHEHHHHHGQKKSTQTPDHFGGIFTVDHDLKAKPDKEEDKKVKAILERLRHYGIDTMVESNAQYALRTAHGNPDDAFKLLMLLQETYEGIVRPYNPSAKLLGAVNREAVTCYLDALLFSMFARLDSFEAMLYENFEDLSRRRLAGLLRLWVNLLRSGRLITTDVTAHLQTALAECGWEDAGQLKQQDPSEAFTFITGQLELPLLTLKMDLYHTGKEDPQDDHKFVNERLLEVAILDHPTEGRGVITLEDCLEHYFNNRIEVKRHLENRRRNTLKSMQPDEPAIKVEKEGGLHVEVAELSDRPDTPILTQSPMGESPGLAKTPVEKLRPTAGRHRANSLFSQRKVDLSKMDSDTPSADDIDAMTETKVRKMSTRTEVLMPAWQFFKLLPWYTDHLPTSDAQVAAHFSTKRPVLGICLKRYQYTMSGSSSRRATFVDIPLEIGVPDFVSGDNIGDDGPLRGNFRLMLQSVVCHRGSSVHSGHYITLCRGTAANAQTNDQLQRDNSDSDDLEDPWMRFDDLARERVIHVDINEALRQETPYLLFYQVQPIDDDGEIMHDLPSYAEAISRSHSDVAPAEKTLPQQYQGSDLTLSSSDPDASATEAVKTDATDFAISSTRTSLDASTALDGSRGRSSLSVGEERRRSIAFDSFSFGGSTSGGSVRTDSLSTSVPTTPLDEKAGGFLSVANRLGSRRASRQSKTSAHSRSRPTSVGPSLEPTSSRFSLNMTKLTQRMSRTDAQAMPPTLAVTTEPSVGEKDVADSVPKTPDTLAPPSYTGRASEDGGSSSSKVPVVPVPVKSRAAEKASVVAAHKEKKRHGHHRSKDPDRDCVVM